MINRLNSLFAAVVFVVTTLTAGCGGGTVGTDGGAPLRVSGTVSDTSGQVLADALVILEATGDSARSNERGHFEIITSRVENSRFRVDTKIKGSEFSVVSDKVSFDQASDDLVFAIAVSVEEGDLSVEILNVEKLPPEPTPVGSEAQPTPVQTPIAKSALRGVVRDQNGNLISDVRITVDGDRTSTVSDRKGAFELAFTPRESRIGVLFEYQKRRARISLTGLPAKPARVTLKIVLKVAPKSLVPQSQSEELVETFSYRVK